MAELLFHIVVLAGAALWAVVPQLLAALRRRADRGSTAPPTLRAHARRPAGLPDGAGAPPETARGLLGAAVLAQGEAAAPPEAVTAALRQHILPGTSAPTPPRRARQVAQPLPVAEAMRLRLSLGRADDGLAPRALAGRAHRR